MTYSAPPHTPQWQHTLRTGMALVVSILFISACFWFGTGSNELQMRKARTMLSDVHTPVAFNQAFDHLVNCADVHSCALGTTLTTRVKIFWLVAKSTGAVQFAPSANNINAHTQGVGTK